MIDGVIVKKIPKYTDERGWLAEVWREDEVRFKPAMCYVSITKPGVVRGPHEHDKQSDCFIFIGPGNFELHLWDKKGAHDILSVGQDNPALVIVPPGVVHGYKNISDVDALSINLPNALYRGKDKAEEIDEIRWELDKQSLYKID